MPKLPKIYSVLLKNTNVDNLGNICWKHRANSAKDFLQALKDPLIHAIEVDFSMSCDGAPVGFHPPSTSSYVVRGDLSLETALSQVIKHNQTYPNKQKLLKIDAKDFGVIKYMNQLTSIASGFNQPLILNCDVLGLRSRFSAQRFSDLCILSPFNLIVSPGFNTGTNPNGVYTRADINSFFDIFGGMENVTLPIRVGWIVNKPKSLKQVLRVVSRGIPLTLWNGRSCEPWMIEWVKANIDQKWCMYDFYNS